ncbi:exosortase family protein XrtF [Flavobacteriaceae bacterium F08102]|nr:exosortase family protein XrtF [Flavobacteriaceae bacterium F08102]
MKKRKTIIKFLLKFFITYFLLLSIYSIYLQKTQDRTVFSCAPITKMVANHTAKLAQLFGYESRTVQHEGELSMKFYVDDLYAARIVEGCNAVSVIILFLTFIIAFSGSLKATIVFGTAGVLIIYVVNLFRILLLSFLMHNFPEYTYFLHNLFFPAVIYGTTFILWIIWVNKFSYIKKSNA